MGACGQTNVDTDFIVALSTQMYGQGSHCGRVSYSFDAECNPI